jgi:hypothetical protein
MLMYEYIFIHIAAEGEGPEVPGIEEAEKLARKVMVCTYVHTYYIPICIYFSLKSHGTYVFMYIHIIYKYVYTC